MMKPDARHTVREAPAGAAQAAIDELRARALKHVRRERARLAKRLENIRRDADETSRAPLYRQWGELLKPCVSRIAHGMRQISVTDYFSENLAQVTVPLDPARTPHENIARLFDKADKLERAKPVIARRLAETAAALDAAEARCLLAETTTDPATLEQMLPQPRVTAKNRARPEEETRVRAFISSDGLRILVGRSAKDNDYLTLRVARGNDWWLHLHNRPGCHAVVRVDRKQDVPRTTLAEAARLCAHFSHVPDGEIEEVTYTQRKHVSKPRGAKPGLVMVAAGRTIAIRQVAAAMKEWVQEHDARNVEGSELKG